MVYLFKILEKLKLIYQNRKLINTYFFSKKKIKLQPVFIFYKCNVYIPKVQNYYIDFFDLIKFLFISLLKFNINYNINWSNYSFHNIKKIKSTYLIIENFHLYEEGKSLTIYHNQINKFIAANGSKKIILCIHPNWGFRSVSLPYVSSKNLKIILGLGGIKDISKSTQIISTPSSWLFDKFIKNKEVIVYYPEDLIFTDIVERKKILEKGLKICLDLLMIK
jgi:hypothetical protein